MTNTTASHRSGAMTRGSIARAADHSSVVPGCTSCGACTGDFLNMRTHAENHHISTLQGELGVTTVYLCVPCWLPRLQPLAGMLHHSECCNCALPRHVVLKEGFTCWTSLPAVALHQPLPAFAWVGQRPHGAHAQRAASTASMFKVATAASAATVTAAFTCCTSA